MARQEVQAQAEFSRKWTEYTGNGSGHPCGRRVECKGLRVRKFAEAGTCQPWRNCFWSAEEAESVLNPILVVVVGRGLGPWVEKAPHDGGARSSRGAGIREAERATEQGHPVRLCVRPAVRPGLPQRGLSPFYALGSLSSEVPGLVARTVRTRPDHVG